MKFDGFGCTLAVFCGTLFYKPSVRVSTHPPERIRCVPYHTAPYPSIRQGGIRYGTVRHQAFFVVGVVGAVDVGMHVDGVCFVGRPCQPYRSGGHAVGTEIDLAFYVLQWFYLLSLVVSFLPDRKRWFATIGRNLRA